MCYKAEVQKKNEIKLEEIFKKENIPDFIQDYFLSISSRAARLNYWITIRNIFNWLIEKEYIECKSVSEITPEILDKVKDSKVIRYMDYLKESEIKLSTLNTKRNQLSSFWQWMKNHHYCKDNIIQMIKSSEYKPVKTNRMKMEKMPLYEDIQEMIEKINKKPDEFVRRRNIAVFRTLRGTGLRESELAGLDLKDVYLDEQYIDSRHPRPYILVISKGNYDYTDDGKDIVYLTKDAITALTEWLKYRETLNNIIDIDALFLNKNGKRMNEDNIKAMFRIYSKGKLTPHMMRHEYTTVLQRESNDPTFVREQGRWKSDIMMNNVYSSGASRSVNVLDNM
jgi:site-specific recombinase XerD